MVKLVTVAAVVAVLYSLRLLREIILNGSINAQWCWRRILLGNGTGSGSGGAIRLVAARIWGAEKNCWRSRIFKWEIQEDVSDLTVTRMILAAGFPAFSLKVRNLSSFHRQVKLPQLTVTSVGGVPVSASPTGALSTPDAVLSAQQNNPIPVVVSCANLPLNTQITVSVKPANSAAVSATGYNTTGTLSSSTATISIVIPRGGGLIYATAATRN